MNKYISKDLGNTFVSHANDLYVVIGIGCSKIEPIIYDIIRGNEIEKVKTDLNLINLQNLSKHNETTELLQLAETWEDYHDLGTNMAFGIEQDIFQELFFSSNIGNRIYCECTDFIVLIINKGPYKNMIDLISEVQVLIV